MIPILDLSRQTAALLPQIEALWREITTSGSFVLGRHGRALEAEIAALSGTRFALGVASGTDALHLVLRALGLGPGDEVITTPFSFIATAEAISYCGATPVFVDIDPATFNIDPARIEERITPRTRAVLPVHLFGQAADLEPILAVAEPHGLAVVEDCAQAIGTLYRGQPVGSFGVAGCLSFYPTKNLGAFGDGGMVVTSNPELAHRIASLRVHGSHERYYHDEVGYCSRLDELQAAVLRVKLPHLEQWNLRRAQIADRYDALLADLPLITPARAAYSTHTFHQYTVRTDARERVLALLREWQIGSGVYYPVPLHLQKAYAHLGYRPGDLPNAEKVAAEVFSLPMYPELDDEQIDQVAAALAGATAAVKV
ncbi:DegT/DnrJ/EryC1/StrS family aminotransferase [Gloeobacter kilaueensis]|uniref:DegT/DnrJ/EryC1/StrS aminotransferase n=1 Tax=Gloeobacter kilaueensis (strain ATCC BAA-2537 / CCAP 1431/1 / ULC 316 / JS1) TaxID=1183438 RepID=U5QHW9_GLOK1|nr:DegT/DnrJ/EryC1/StrS family aminotransferase [Gloeobacter kilaueensis]AGY58572.1 DegT/DnrJ/EryC1/StrS aminotransferase [Gloeobacter kilaueensis JS1]